jgi:hypothetical protein
MEPVIDLATVDKLLTTTRSVRKRLDFTRPVPSEIIYHPQSGWFEDTPLKGGAEEGYPLKGVHEGTCLCEAQQRAWNHSRASWVSPW